MHLGGSSAAHQAACPSGVIADSHSENCAALPSYDSILGAHRRLHSTRLRSAAQHHLLHASGEP